MPRHFNDWIEGFMDYAGFGEAPRYMYFWTAVSTIAGALRRKVWIDQAYFKWYPNQFIIIVAPPGIVSKSTTAGIGMNLLRKVPGIKFGPDVVTWPALVSKFAEATEAFEYEGEYHTMSALTLESSEFGNLFDPKDNQMVDLFVNLWDGKQGTFEKTTKNSGCDLVENPWINMIACTTPAWIAQNFPEYMIGGGFTSRCVFVYADKKSKLVAYPCLEVPPNMKEIEAKLVADLEQISMLTGEYKLTPDAYAYGKIWYEKHYSQRPVNMDDERFAGYLARKQTHLHKLAMILAAAEGDRMWITPAHLETAGVMVTDLEADMALVFSKIGKSDESIYADRLVAYVQKRSGAPYAEVYRFVHAHFPSMRGFEDVLAGCIKAGYVQLVVRGNEHWITPGSIPEARSEGV